MKTDQLKFILKESVERKTFLHAIMSSPRFKSKESSKKLVVRPLEIKKDLVYQVSDYIGEKVFHRNIHLKECLNYLYEQVTAFFKQTVIYTREADYHVLVNRKMELTILKKAPTKSPLLVTHNRKKHYLIEEGEPVDFLVELGVMTQDGKVVAKKSDKFRQINRFLEMVDDVLPALDKSKKLQIIDFGCGKAYLTFALYYYLHFKHHYTLEIQGLDLKEDVVKNCQKLAKQLNYDQLHFSLGDIKHYQCENKVDLVVALHACDTATDAAIEKAIQWNAEVILTVPCCQHEVFKQIKNQELKPLLKHGILKERFSALVTDAFRAQFLEVSGYETQVLEFIDLEHTPKNLLIRAIKRKQNVDVSGLLEEYQLFKESLSIKPYLDRCLDNKKENIPSN